MIHFKFSERDNRYLFLKIDNKEDEMVMHLLMDHLNLVDPICYLPTWKGPKYTQDQIWEHVQPDGTKVWYCAIGLWQEVYKYLKESKVTFDGLIENSHMFKRTLSHTYEQFCEIVSGWNLKFPPRDYQLKAAYGILQWYQSLSVLSTRAGKTLIAYMVFRYLREYLGVKKILAIVPSITLVKQMHDDFKEYAEFFVTEQIWARGEFIESADFTVGTYQSLIKFLDKTSKKYNPKFFEGYDALFVDEVHRATASETTMIITNPFMKNLKISFGMTGTLPKEHTIPFYALHALLGAKIEHITPRELMDEGYISEVSVKQIRLRYGSPKMVQKTRDIYVKCAEYCISDFVTEEYINKNGKKTNKKVELSDPQFLYRYKKVLPNGILDVKGQMDFTNEMVITQYIEFLKSFIPTTTKTNSFQVERMMVHFLDERIEYLCNELLPKFDRNSLVLAHHTEYISHLYNVIKERFPNKIVEVITGATKAKERERIIGLMKQHDNCILVASYGTLSTGITLNNLCFGVLFESFESEVINIQSIGRGLGLKNDGNNTFAVYDFIDCFHPEAATNKIYQQGVEKTKMYDEYKYPYEIINVKL